MPAKEYRDGWTGVLVRFPDDMVAKLEAYRAARPGLSPSRTEVIRQAVSEFLDRNPVAKPRRRLQHKAARQSAA
jgi:Arc/MetJ-type ribon-helix-helix transcriptional regulator